MGIKNGAIKINRQTLARLGILLTVLFLFSACGNLPDTNPPVENEQIRIVVTTTFIGDVISTITEDTASVTILLSSGQNPHSYQPTPRDMVQVSEADLIFVNGLDLEEFLDDLLDGSDTDARVIVVSEGISPMDAGDYHEDNGGAGDPIGLDPHVWFNPNNVLIWAENITRALIESDPSNADQYRANSDSYQDELLVLDAWIREQINLIPEKNRELVTDHSSLGYFAEEYGLSLVGAVIPALTTEAETSGQQLAELIDTIREHKIRAIFVGIDYDQALAQRVADETDVVLIPLYFGSLSEGDPAGTYLTFMYYNVNAIVDGLK